MQWSGDDRVDPANAVYIDQELNNDVADIVESLEGPLPQTLSSWTFFSPALIECQKQLSSSSQRDAFKLCILMTDGINNDNDEWIYKQSSASGVGQWCQDHNITSETTPEVDVCIKPEDDYTERSAIPSNSCASCVEAEDKHCSTNPWDEQCLSGCLSAACAPSCTGVCTTENIASVMHDAMGIKMAGVLVSDTIDSSKLAQATATVKKVSSCKNETELGESEGAIDDDGQPIVSFAHPLSSSFSYPN